MKKHLLLAITCAAGVLASAATASAQSNYEPYSFRTLAGLAGSAGSVDSTGRFNQPSGVATDSAGNIYVADSDNHTIRKVAPGGVVTTLAGLAGNPGSADGTGSAARFNNPMGVATDSDGNVYVADRANHTIRKVTPDGVVTTLAGLAGGYGSADGTGSAARFAYPYGAATDSAGNVYVADRDNSTIRKVSPGGVVTTLAGLAGSPGSADGTGSEARFSDPMGVATDSAGNVYVADDSNHTVRKVTPGGVVTTLAGLAGNPGSADGTGSDARFNFPQGVATDSAGNVYVTDAGNDTIRKVTPGGVVTTLAGLAGSPGSADGTGSAARFTYPRGVATDSAGNVYVADRANNTIRKVTPDGVVTTVAGLAERFFNPTGVATDSAGNVYVADSDNNTIRKVTPGGVVTTLAGQAGSYGSADGTGSAARFDTPYGVATDTAGNVYVADRTNNTIRKVTPGGVVTTLAGLAGSYGSADGTGSDARFNYPQGVATDSGGNVYVADSSNHTIRKVTPGGVVTTLAGLAESGGSADGTGSAASFFYPYGVATDSPGNVYVADTYNSTIRKVTPGGVVTTLAGLAGSDGSADGTGSAARFAFPHGVATDSAANVYVADSNNHTIRKVTPGGVVTTLAGLAGSSGSVDGTGSTARFYQPPGVATDSAGNVYVADAGNNTVRATTANNVPTPVGSNVAVDGGTLASTDINLTFSQVTTEGTTSLSLIAPATAGPLPTGYQIAGADLAFEISTTAGYTSPVTIAFHVPSVDDATFAQLRVLHNESGTLVDRTATTPAPDAVNKIIYASTPSLSPFVLAKRIYKAKIQGPINRDGSSVFSVVPGVVPVKFSLALGGAPTCSLPAATIAVIRTSSGTTGSVNESVYRGAADTSGNFRVVNCRYVYNLSSPTLGVGTYKAKIKIAGRAVGSCTFQLK